MLEKSAKVIILLYYWKRLLNLTVVSEYTALWYDVK